MQKNEYRKFREFRVVSVGVGIRQISLPNQCSPFLQNQVTNIHNFSDSYGQFNAPSVGEILCTRPGQLYLNDPVFISNQFSAGEYRRWTLDIFLSDMLLRLLEWGTLTIYGPGIYAATNPTVRFLVNETHNRWWWSTTWMNIVGLVAGFTNIAAIVLAIFCLEDSGVSTKLERRMENYSEPTEWTKEPSIFAEPPAARARL
jgi:hypothetical protein